MKRRNAGAKKRRGSREPTGNELCKWRGGSTLACKSGAVLRNINNRIKHRKDKDEEVVT